MSLHSFSTPATIGVSTDFDKILDSNVGLFTIIILSLMYADCIFVIKTNCWSLMYCVVNSWMVELIEMSREATSEQVKVYYYLKHVLL